MKNVLIVTDFWQPSINGITRMLENHVRYLESRGFFVTVVHPRMFFNTPLFFYKDVRLAFFLSRKIKQVFKEKRPDFIFIATEGFVGQAVRRYCVKNNLRFITAYQGNIPQYIEYYTKLKSSLVFKWAYAYFRWFHSRSSAVLVATKSLQRELAIQGFAKLAYCPLGVDIEFFKKTVPLLEISHFEKPVFVYLGRVAEEKNIEEFLQCSLPGTKLVIGDGPVKKSLEKKYPQAHFLGWHTGSSLVRVLSGCDVFVFPSVTETFGLVIIEALACEIPVAAHNVMGPKDIISQGIDGWLDKDLEKAALKCLELDRAACRKKALEFSLKKTSQLFLDILTAHPCRDSNY